MKILFQGDSITDAFRKPEEINPAYRLGNGYAFIAAARLAFDHPELCLEFENRGISGNKVSDLKARWEQDALAHNADVLSILVGVNNTIMQGPDEGARELEDFLADYAGLIEASLSANPELKIIVMEPFLLPVESVPSQWHVHLRERQKGIGEMAARLGLTWLPLQSRFDKVCASSDPAYWAYDGIHPTHPGAHLIAEAWLEAATPLIVPRS